MANGEEPGGEEPKSTIDTLNDAADKIRRAKSDVQNVQKGARFAQKGAQAIRAGVQGIRAGASAAQGASAAAGMMGGAEGGAAAAGAGAAAAGAAEGAGAAAAGAAAAGAAEGAAVAAGGTAAGATVEFWGPVAAVLLGLAGLAMVFIVIITIITGSPKGNTPPDCGTIGGTCTTGTTCAPPSTQDTTGATCSPDATGQPQICCVTPKNCGSVGGTCTPGATCDSPLVPETSGATCDPTASGTQQTCCINLSECESLGPTSAGILCWARKINNALELARPCSNDIYNRQQQTITNAAGYKAFIRPGTCNGFGAKSYFCTDEVGDSYNLAGIKKDFSEWVPSMMSQWNSVPGLRLLYSNDVRSLRAGDAVFWHSPSEGRYGHTDIIDSISVDSNGLGWLYTIDANVNVAKVKNPVVGWKVRGTTWSPAADGVAFGLSPR